MDLSLYYETELEQWISSRYIQHGILCPSDLDIDEVSTAFKVDLVEYEGPPFSCNMTDVIFLPKGIDTLTKRLVYFHELCHVLRHAGNQRQMPELFLQQQEIEAERFIQYAAAPFYMIKELPLGESQKEAVELIASEFTLPYKFSYARLLQIQNRILNQITAQENARIPGGNRNERDAQELCIQSEETQRIMTQLSRQLSKGVKKLWQE
ncbi:ImmA/IrrE family metallo-endopeptidase [Paenibacillus sp. YPG26]|uniref:ImmA/IrrE family metallo-endopeptidase n=1 Tax=Paenibacillus sp. YPG26 TaxID=2878915 RepID=UPI00203EDCCB|nr:ImmA/IrrE family metallo-endopeptidase [Paenibacillus sp. YPG26]USB34538.1 ImmA/IrrE family metallo-endopeptidase [Paenibacillus sp. YPG26]